MSEGVRARSRTSARSVSARSNSKKLKSREINGNQVLEDGVAKAFAEESFIADEDVGRAQSCASTSSQRNARLG